MQRRQRATNGDNLTERQRRFAAARASGATVTAAAVVVGVSERTAQRYNADPGVVAEVRRLGDELLADVTRAARSEIGRSVEVIAEVRDNAATPPAVRLSAAVRMVEAAARLGEQFDLAERIGELEGRLNGNVA